MIGSATVARFAARGWGLYAVGIGLNAACGVLYLGLRSLVVLIDAWPGDVMQQHYFCFYVPVLSARPPCSSTTTSTTSSSSATGWRGQGALAIPTTTAPADVADP